MQAAEPRSPKISALQPHLIGAPAKLYSRQPCDKQKFIARDFTINFQEKSWTPILTTLFSTSDSAPPTIPLQVYILQNASNQFSTESAKMPSVKNPNVPQKARRLATRGKVQKRKANGAAFTSDKNPSTSNPRNPRANTLAPGATLYPTSGPLAPLSKKKAKKVERAQRLARQRMVEKLKKEGGEVDMTGE
jgi:hypothetical protein